MLENLLTVNSFLNIIIRGLCIVLLFVSIYFSIHILNKKIDDKYKISINKVKILRYFIYALIFCFIILLYKRYSILRVTSVTLIVSVVISYILNPFVKFFEKKKIKRLYSIIIVYLIIILSITILILGIFPSTIAQVKNLFKVLPDIVKNFINYTENLRDSLFTNFPTVNNWIDGVNAQLLKFTNMIATSVLTWITNMIVGIKSMIAFVIQLILIPVMTFYLLLEKDKILFTIGNATPKRYKTFLINLWQEIDMSLSMFVRGRIIMAIFVGVATTIYLAVFGIEFALVIGIVTCIADIIPYIGPFLGFVPAVLLALFKGPITAIWVGALFCIVQWIENNIIGPKILGDSTGMHPLIVLILLITGGGMFGVVGMIFSVPIVAAIAIIFRHLRPYIKKYLYKDKLNND